MVAAHSPYFAGVRLRSIAGIWFRHALVLRHTWLPSLTWYFVEPFVILIAIGVGIGTLVEDVDGLPYARFVTPGVIAGSAMFHAIFECSWGSFFRIQKGVYETTLTAPVSTREIAMGDISWAMSRGGDHGLLHRHSGGHPGVDRFPFRLRSPACGCAHRHAVWSVGAHIRRAVSQHSHTIPELHGGGVAPLLLQRGVLPNLSSAGLG